MRKDKEQSIILRRSGKSYNEISVMLGMPKSTLSNWLKKTKWSNKIKALLTERNNKRHGIRIKKLDNIRGENLARLYKQARLEAAEEFENFKFHPLFLAGMGIYWGEGNKASLHNVVVGNSDPLMVKVFVKFLKEICGVPPKKIRGYVLIYPDLNDDICKNFWIKNSGLNRDNFNQSVRILGRHKTRRITNGVCSITVSSRYLKEKILEWLRLWSLQLVNNYYKRI